MFFFHANEKSEWESKEGVHQGPRLFGLKVAIELLVSILSAQPVIQCQKINWQRCFLLEFELSNMLALLILEPTKPNEFTLDISKFEFLLQRGD